MQDSAHTQNQLCNQALDAENSGQNEHAATLFRQAIVCDRSNPVPYLFLGNSLCEMGQMDSAVQAWSLAADLDSRIINAWRGENLSADIRERSKLADQLLRTHFTTLHKESVEGYQKRHPRADVQRVAAAIWCQTHNSVFDYQHPRQRPHIFYVPDLAPIPVYGDEHMPWKSELEAACADIAAEFLVAREQAADQEKPYLEAGAASLGEDWKPLAGSTLWSSFELYRLGVPNKQLLDLFPVTLETLGRLPTIEGPHGPREVVFSVLRGEQRIPEHFGVANTDMTVHLPLITTEDSAIRVVDEVHAWQKGEVFAFDDAFDHESWNDDAQPRVNLLFEVWHPELTEDEQAAIAESFDARERWNKSRSV